MSEKPEGHPYDVIPLDHCAAIGVVVLTWADLELAFDRAIWILLQVDQQIGACVTSQMASAFHRLNAIASLADERGASEAICKRLTTYAGSISTLSEARNRTVHDARFLGVESSTVSRFQSTAKARLVFEHKKEDVTALHELAEKIAASKKTFVAIWQEMADELNRLPAALRKRPRQIVFPYLESLNLTKSF
jgi:hypothetical protein